MLRAAIFIASLMFCAGAAAGEADQGQSPYAGQEGRAIKALSDDDIDKLLAGEGWGLAKPAELNGIPGPRHVLDLAEDLNLTADQHLKIQAIFDTMRQKAKILGRKYIDLEANLDRAFMDGSLEAKDLEALLQELGETRAGLRYTHLKAHLETSAILDQHQNALYPVLRGYQDNIDHNAHH